GKFFKWLGRKDNSLFGRLSVWAVLLFLAAGIVSLCFAFISLEAALCLSAVPFFGFSLFYCFVDRKYALKVPLQVTGRVKCLAAVYFFLIACVTYAVIALSAFVGGLVAAQNPTSLYLFVQYLPVAVMPMLLPALAAFANVITSPFENARNRRYVKKATAKIGEKQALKVAVVGSYGKTSVKQILTTLLSQKYQVCATPASYNTPMGVAKTVMGESFDGAEVFVVEMGARKAGDIGELCQMVQPDYALFTGVCAQHIATFGSIEEVKAEKSRIFESGAKKIFCAPSLQEEVRGNYEQLSEDKKSAVCFLTGNEISDLRLAFDRTQFTLKVGGEEIAVDVPLLGKHSAENIALCAALAVEMGVSKEQLEKGLAALQPVEHRLQLTKENGVYILDDAYNANERGAEEAIDALCRFGGRKILVTPGLVETGVLEKALGEKLGAKIAEAKLDLTILVGETQIACVKNGYLNAGGDLKNLMTISSLERAKEALSQTLQAGDAVLFLNDLPDVY
ncbi:MAG: UDP-N-acetylmuramoyl-tripeptide--D-alanyl-D-alanine ligase, partial [Clostridia bacterium]|nr:UDP-N-acetylmuramoyl-tripeptide--D-alanyl-D-alanine ligase [Clostridia bacterium]